MLHFRTHPFPFMHSLIKPSIFDSFFIAICLFNKLGILEYSLHGSSRISSQATEGAWAKRYICEWAWDELFHLTIQNTAILERHVFMKCAKEKYQHYVTLGFSATDIHVYTLYTVIDTYTDRIMEKKRFNLQAPPVYDRKVTNLFFPIIIVSIIIFFSIILSVTVCPSIRNLNAF